MRQKFLRYILGLLLLIATGNIISSNNFLAAKGLSPEKNALPTPSLSVLSAKPFQTYLFFDMPESYWWREIAEECEIESNFHFNYFYSLKEKYLSGNFNFVESDSELSPYSNLIQKSNSVPLFILHHSWKSFIL